MKQASQMTEALQLANGVALHMHEQQMAAGDVHTSCCQVKLLITWSGGNY